MTLSSVPDHLQRYIPPLTCAPGPVRVGRCPGRSGLPGHLPGIRPADLPGQTPAGAGGRSPVCRASGRDSLP